MKEKETWETRHKVEVMVGGERANNTKVTRNSMTIFIYFFVEENDYLYFQ